MSRYIDADRIDIRAREGYDHDGVLYLPYRDVRKSLDSAPSIDICFCRECKYWNESTKGCQRNPSVEAWQADDFCSYGQKGDENVETD